MLPGVDGGDGLRNVSCSNVEGRVLGWVIVTRRGCDDLVPGRCRCAANQQPSPFDRYFVPDWDYSNFRISWSV